jgi:hypothetical protein
MKRGIFNRYVDYVCEGVGISRDILFKKTKESRASSARFLLYSICYQRPMTIVQIVDLMSENGYDTNRTTIEYGIKKVSEETDKDVLNFINKCIS